ncbi:HAMP domain-containing protein [Kribbella qitaiheensis]|uniref:histidine kinase n=1 Tax=Kribbella qitaiheensis TaxID=1544730 RepID=A0A7G6WS00_9ACTN|nr:ATP-binding protein [Kribbella qitaiheensis]QNE16765.1 HAMP domain-containing protein [Kribbella qitaiheensis]
MTRFGRFLAAVRRPGVRGRSTSAAVVVVALALAVGALILLLLLQRALINSVSDAAGDRSLDIATQVKEDGQRGLREELVENTRPSQLIQVLDQNGAVVASSSRRTEPSLTDLRPGDGQILRNEIGRMPLVDDDHDFLIVARGTEFEGARYTVVVASSLQTQRETVETVVFYLLLGFPLLLLLVGLAMWILVGRALWPVERIRAQVHGIGAGQLAERVPVPATQDEIARLAVTMNEMLDRLQSAQETQRRFVADASHELRSPIATLTAALDVVVVDVSGQAWLDLQQVMDAETGRMRRLVEDLLLLAKADDDALRLQGSDVDLDDLIESEVRRLRSSDGPVVQRDVQTVRVRGDADKLSQVIRNLVENASRAARSTVRFTLAEEAGTALLTVEDDGDGVPMADRERVFERFVRLDASRDRGSGGSGLGLAIVSEVLRSHGGSVRITDSPLGGARFEVTLPTESPSPGGR